MPRAHYSPCPPDEVLLTGFRRVRDALDVPETFPEEVTAEADAIASRGPRRPPGVPERDPVDHRGIAFVAIDPSGSLDIDQAFSAQRTKHGYLVHYAIADLGSFVVPGGAIDAEARRRGLTFYSPDMRSSLHPEALNHGVASLLPGQDRAALVWSIKLDHDGSIHDAIVERSVVRNREAISYRTATDRLLRVDAPEELRLLREIGRLRQEVERRRHAVSLQLPSQEIVRDDGGYRLGYAESLPIEGWNAQISLLTGMAAAQLMVDAGVGILRTLPPPSRETMAELRAVAAGLRIGWHQQVGYAERVRELDPSIPNEAALLSTSARGLRGAGYASFVDGDLPADPEHSAIASTYAHVTAPLRRLGDRFANEIVLSVCGGYPSPAWVLEALPEIPKLMGKARGREGRLERRLLDFMEAAVLAGRVGDELDAVVSSRSDDEVTVTITDPAVIARITHTGVELGQRLRVRVAAADPSQSHVELVPLR